MRTQGWACSDGTGLCKGGKERRNEERSEMAAPASLSFSRGWMLMDWLESEYSIAGEILVWLDWYSGRTGMS